MKREPSSRAAKPPRKQCKKCPWKVDTDPHEIPRGYSEEKHRGLVETISEGTANLHLGAHGGLKIFTCHETNVRGKPALPCVGWLLNQLGPGNNLGLRVAVHCGRIDDDVETVGEQHERFEDTLPKRRRRRA